MNKNKWQGKWKALPLSRMPANTCIRNDGVRKRSFDNHYHNYFISHASKVMLKILQARLQQYVNHELPDVQASFRKGRGTRDQIANICWIIKKARRVPENNLFLLY